MWIIYSCRSFFPEKLSLALLGAVLLTGCFQSDDKKIIAELDKVEIRNWSSSGRFLENHLPEIHSLVVFKNGQPVFTYSKLPFTPAVAHYLHSAGKLVTNLLTFIAIDKGLIKSETDLLTDYFSLRPDSLQVNTFKDLRIEDLLQMKSGLTVDESELDRDAPVLPQLLAKCRKRENHADNCHYQNLDPILLGIALKEAAGKDVYEFAMEELMRPLGIDTLIWEKTVDGYPIGSGAMLLSSASLAKLGNLILQKGMWNGKRIISEKWTDRMLSTDSVTNESTSWLYGFGWWIIPGTGFAAWGHGGQLVAVFPQHNAVIACNARINAEDDRQLLSKMLEKLILPNLTINQSPAIIQIPWKTKISDAAISCDHSRPLTGILDKNIVFNNSFSWKFSKKEDSGSSNVFLTMNDLETGTTVSMEAPLNNDIKYGWAPTGFLGIDERLPAQLAYRTSCIDKNTIALELTHTGEGVYLLLKFTNDGKHQTISYEVPEYEFSGNAVGKPG